MVIANPLACRSVYPPEHKALMAIERVAECEQWLSTWEHLRHTPTPLWSLPDLAHALGVTEIRLKDESTRSSIKSFKALGAPIALIRLILRLYSTQKFDPAALLTGRYRDDLHALTVISATDGNHGRALAAAAQSAGCRCLIVLPEHVSAEREQAIAIYGAEIIRVADNYDAAVAEAARLAAAHGWHVVSDTSYPEYEIIPRDVMQGYGIIVQEILDEIQASPDTQSAFTHVFLQGGVGALPAGILAHFWEFYGAQRPVGIIVEPVQADCLYQSARVGHAAHATGSVTSIMAGLACGDASPLAWKLLRGCADFFMTIEDSDAVACVRQLARGSQRDVPIVAGESGAAGLAGLQIICESAVLRAQIGLDSRSRVLVISSEGATAPQGYQAQIGESAASVLARQTAWLAKP
ncbi:diaminopropionate ammonia-lyase [Alcaligenaceae bacterium CGII-47]|nr:diaminopropionate ammonia-lyase [Alcaligenaceae bacterium CGII-47]